MRSARLSFGAAVLVGAAVLAAPAVLAGCGTASPGLSATASAQLSATVEAMRAAAAAGNRTETAADLARLQAQLSTLEKQGQVTSAKAAAILSAAGAVRAQLVDLPAPTTTSTTTTTTTTVPPTTTTIPQRPAGQHNPGPAPDQHGPRKGDH